MLWHATTRFAPHGDIGKFSNTEIAEMAQYDGDAEALIEALIEAGWLDRSPKHRLIIHDWHQHAPRFVQLRASRRDTYFVGENIPDKAPVDLAGLQGRVAELIGAWNGLGNGFQEVRPTELSLATKRLLKQRLADPKWPEQWKAALEAIPTKPFLCGQGKTGWRATFEWFLKSDSVGKILSGNYPGAQAVPAETEKIGDYGYDPLPTTQIAAPPKP